jgi:PAS domain S-box-containing protein
MIFRKKNEYRIFILAGDESFSLEHRLFLSTVLIGIFACLFASIVSIVLSSSIITLIIGLSWIFLLTILYYIARIKKIFKPFVIPLITVTFLGIAIIWIFDGGINGSDLMPGFVILILALIIVPDKTRKYIIVLFIALIIFIYLIQFYRPDLITGFPSEKVRWTDSIVTAIYSSFFIFLIIRFLLKNYTIERQRAEENEIKFRALSENSQDYITRYDRHFHHTYINKAGIKVTGLTERQIIGKTPRESGIYNENQSNMIEKTIEKVFTSKQPQFEQYNLPGENGPTYFDLRLFPEFNDRQEVVSVLGVSRDITILKQTEIKLLELNVDKDRFISILAHDLRNPFNTILGFSEILIDDIRTQDLATTEKQIGIIHSISQKTFNLLDDLLLWAKSQSGKLDFKPQIIDFEKTCQETVDNIKSNALLKRIEVNYTPTGSILLLADENMLKIVLRNLISNAIKFTSPGGQINIQVEKAVSMLTITVSDNGVGIAPAMIDKLFDISQIITTAGTSDEKGTGLGLLLCKEFVEIHGGKIWVESIQGKGSDFKFILPVGSI